MILGSDASTGLQQHRENGVGGETATVGNGGYLGDCLLPGCTQFNSVQLYECSAVYDRMVSRHSAGIHRSTQEQQGQGKTPSLVAEEALPTSATANHSEVSAVE